MQFDDVPDVIGGFEQYCAADAVCFVPDWRKSAQGASAGTATFTYTQNNPLGALHVVGGWELHVGAYTCPAGTWTVRFNNVTDNIDLTVTDVDICHVRGGVSIASIGHADTALNLEFTGVKTAAVTGIAVTLQAGDYVAVLLTMQNDNELAQTVDYKSNQNITTPLVSAGMSAAIKRRLLTRGGNRWL